MLRAYFGENFVHRPDRSGFPSGPRGAGAVRFGLPSAVRGMPGVFRSSHWASTEIAPPRKMSAARKTLIEPSGSAPDVARWWRDGNTLFEVKSPRQLERNEIEERQELSGTEAAEYPGKEPDYEAMAPGSDRLITGISRGVGAGRRSAARGRPGARRWTGWRRWTRRGVHGRLEGARWLGPPVD